MWVYFHFVVRLGCPLALLDLQTDPVTLFVETVDFGHGHFETPAVRSMAFSKPDFHSVDEHRPRHSVRSSCEYPCHQESGI